MIFTFWCTKANFIYILVRKKYITESLYYSTQHIMTMAQNLFRRHRGTRSETANSESSNNRNESPSTNNDNNGQSSRDNDGEVSTNSTLDIENPLNNETSSSSANSNSNQNDQEEPLEINEQDHADDDDEIQELVIRTNSASNNNNISAALDPTNQFPNWTLNEEEINTRREAIRIEIERMQRANFVHFVVLCLVPTSLLVIVIAAILTEDGECSGDGLTVCEREPRTFVNAFTTRCICEAVGTVLMDSSGGGNEKEVP